MNAGPGASIEIPVEVDYGRPFTGSDLDAWEDEYAASVQGDPNESMFNPQVYQRSATRCRLDSGQTIGPSTSMKTPPVK